MIHVIGLGMNPDNLPEEYVDILDAADVLAGGKRHLAMFDDHPVQTVVLASPMDEAIEAIRQFDELDREVVVLATGDPLFFGIGQTLVNALGPDRLHFLPNVTVVQAAAARLKVAWQDMETVSLHGRDDIHRLLAALIRSDWVALLTDGRFIPSNVAQILLDLGATNYCMWIFEELETPRERFDKYSLEDASHRNFSSLNVVIFEKKRPPERQLRLGAPDEEYALEGGLITKQPVRAVGIASLGLRPGDTVWDLGGGCGAVSVEMCAVLGRGRVVCVEKNADRVALVRENVRRFGALLVEAVHGTMPRCLPDLPDPDKVFVGGGLSRDFSLLELAAKRLAPGGRIVVNCVRLDTLARAKAFFRGADWPLQITQMQPATSRELAGDVYLEGANPVFIVAAQKPDQG